MRSVEDVTPPTTTETLPAQTALLARIAERAFAQMVHMIWEANHRTDKRPGDPKVGGHPAACASSSTWPAEVVGNPCAGTAPTPPNSHKHYELA